MHKLGEKVVFSLRQETDQMNQVQLVLSVVTYDGTHHYGLPIV